MAAKHQVPVIGFVWRPEEITPSVTQMARQTGSRAVFDFSMTGMNGLRSFLQKADSDADITDIKISVPAFFDPSLEGVLKATGIGNIWVECHPHFVKGDSSLFLKRLRNLSLNYQCFPIISDTDLLSLILKDHQGIGRIVLKGCEASGLASNETTASLYSMAKQLPGSSSKTLDIFIWGGIFTPEAAAAFLSTGAAGIIFESVHWLTDMVVINDLQRRRLLSLRPDFTEMAGLDLQVPCRIFNKGNSLAFKEIQTIAHALRDPESKEESRRLFADRVLARAIHPLESRFGMDEVIFMGVEAAFAASFVKRFGSGTWEAIKTFMAEIHSLCSLAEAKKNCFIDSAAAKEMGTRYPFIQGAMSWITDVPAFAVKVADAGGLPTVALGLMDAEALEKKLGHLPEIMGNRPYAVNVVTLSENPFRKMHLDWIKKQKPRFAVIAGGDLSPIRELKECGIEVIYIAPDDALLRLALEAGVRYVICEGYEAGGHVGRHSTLTLAQMVLDLKQRAPSLFQNRYVILAGGIFNRETAFMAAMLGADAIQMGTAYLATREIVETGALAPLYQEMILKSPPGGTVVSGQGAGLRVRSLRTPRIEAVLCLEREFATGRQDEASFRTKMEGLAAGSLFTAARGMDEAGGGPLDERTCMERGQFMSGSCAGLISNVENIESFHRDLAEGPLLLHQVVAEQVAKQPKTASESVGRIGARVARQKEDRDRIAITGMSIVNTLGESPEDVWAACIAMKSGITVVPPSRWDHALFYDHRPRVPDKTYCNVGAFLDFEVSRNELGISPHDFRTMGTATKITMWLADRAVRASGILESGIPRERIAVLISQNSGEAAGPLSNMIIREHIHDILSDIKRAVSLTPEQELAVEREIKAGRMAPDDTTLLGRLNCAAPGFICNRYGLMGPSYAVSAACATSLVALHSAIRMIESGIIDAAIVGGGEEKLAHLHFLEFSALGALYGLSGQKRPAQETSRPFDAERDGIVLGEGGAMIVIERESLARARGARVNALITGMGASNNHLGMVEPSSITQEMAVRASFQGIAYGPEAVDLVECHATSTRQGDIEEVRALKNVFNSSNRTVLTSFKSQIGHTLGASGLSSLIRGVSAMNAGVFPPTLNYMHPDPEIDLKGSRLLITPEPLDWKRNSGKPKRLQVNAFGFGGSNFVVQVEQDMDEGAAVMVSPGRSSGFRKDKKDHAPVIDGVSFFRTENNGQKCRLAVVAPSEAEAIAVLKNAAIHGEDAISSPKAMRSLALQKIFISPEQLLPASPLAFVFPGQGAQYGGMGKELYAAFPVIREWMDRAADAADFDLLHLLFNDNEENLQKTRWQQPATFAMENAVARYLISLGIRPAAMAGHSLGELTALCLAGVYSSEDGFRIVNKRAVCMDKAGAANLDPGLMAAVDAPLDLLNEMIRGRDDVHIGNINSPHQVVLSGKTAAVGDLCKRLKEMGHRATLLRVSMAFHSPVMKVIHDELKEFIAAISFHAPRIPVISNTTMMPYPSDPDEIKKILMAHLESTVHWMENVRFLRSEFGVRLFVEIGPGDTLSNLIADTLPESVSIPTCLPSAEALTCKTALARLFVYGHLQVENEPMVVSFSDPMISDPMISEPMTSDPMTSKQVSPIAPDKTSEGSEVMEKLIQIIMDATGYNRDEIRPDMDLRRDLSIRSSRFPIIIDAAERQFSITIELEELMDVRTVNDIAQRISMISARQNGAVPQPAATAINPDPVNPEIIASPEGEANLKRLVFGRATIATSAFIPIKLNPGETVLILSPGKDDGLAETTGDIFRTDYGVGTSAMGFMQESHSPDQDGCDIRSDEGALRAADKIAGLASLSGMVVSFGQRGAERLESMEDVSRLLRGFFILLKAFLQSPAKKFVVLIHSGEDAGTHSRLLAEGMLGLFLSAAHEHASVQFRTLDIEKNTDLRKALRDGLDRGCAVVEMIHRDGKMITSEGNLAPSAFRDSSSLNLGPGDVMVMSGGATGISAHLARALVPFAPRLIFLGRTALDPADDSQESRLKHFSSGSLSPGSRASEIKKTLMNLRLSGIDAAYHTCDVTDPAAVRAVMAETVSRYGRIDGIIHGAGVLKDGFLSQMTPDDFSMVTDVKLLGAWNLFSSARKAGLRFFISLSSVAAVQGNPGQTNYAAANRMMAALPGALRGEKGDVLFKTLMLPPVAGIGMADDPEIQALMKQKGVAYIHANELAGLFCRELFIAPAHDDRVMFMKRLPTLKTALLNDRTGPSSNGRLDGGIVSFSPEDFPMIETVSFIDIHREELEAARSFSLEKDLWITDHRPFRFIKHPIVSAAMVIETFMEAARILYPYLNVRGVQNIGLMDMIQCHPGIARRSKITCSRSGNGHQKVVCALSLAAQEISPAGRLTDRFTSKCKGEVILDGGNGNGEYIEERFRDFPVRSEELQTRSMNQKKVLKWYKNHGGLTGRYRVIEGIDGAGPGEIRGRTRYSETSDFANLQNTRYQYSPYLFEALLQLVGFHTAATDPSERRSAVPMEIGEMKFSRKCLPGERITLEARMRARDSKGLTWDARGHDDQGRTLMQIRGLRMQLVAD